MKKLSGPSGAVAALFIGVGAASALTAAPPASARATHKDGEVTISLSANACTKDGHLFNFNHTFSYPVTETVNNQVTPDELKAIEDAYNASAGPLMNEFWGVYMSLLNSRDVERGIQSFNNPVASLRDPHFPLDPQAKADAEAKVRSLQHKFISAAFAFDSAIMDALKGNLAGARQGGPLKFTVSPAPVPECQPKP